MSESKELEPWQQRALDKMKSFKGRGVVQITGRNAGKSMLSANAVKRLFEDIYSRPIEALVFDVGTVYGSRYYTVEPIGGNWPEMEHWCYETFGNSGTLVYEQSQVLVPQ